MLIDGRRNLFATAAINFAGTFLDPRADFTGAGSRGLGAFSHASGGVLQAFFRLGRFLADGALQVAELGSCAAGPGFLTETARIAKFGARLTGAILSFGFA